MYSVLNTLSEYTFFYILEKLLHYVLLFKIVESLQCIIKWLNLNYNLVKKVITD